MTDLQATEKIHNYSASPVISKNYCLSSLAGRFKEMSDQQAEQVTNQVVHRFFDSVAKLKHAVTVEEKMNEQKVTVEVEHEEEAATAAAVAAITESNALQQAYTNNNNNESDQQQLNDFDPLRDHFESATNTYGIGEDDYAARLLGYGQCAPLTFFFYPTCRYIITLTIIAIHRRPIHRKRVPHVRKDRHVSSRRHLSVRSQKSTSRFHQINNESNTHHLYIDKGVICDLVISMCL